MTAMPRGYRVRVEVAREEEEVVVVETKVPPPTPRCVAAAHALPLVYASVVVTESRTRRGPRSNMLGNMAILLLRIDAILLLDAILDAVLDAVREAMGPDAMGTMACSRVLMQQWCLISALMLMVMASVTPEAD